MKEKKITVMLADCQNLFVEGLEQLFQQHQEFEVVARAYDIPTMIELGFKHRPGILVTDIFLPVPDGLRSIQRVMKQSPDTKVMILTEYTQDHYVEMFLSLGAHGFAVKQESWANLIAMLRQVHAGIQRVACSRIQKLFLRMMGGHRQRVELDILTRRESEVLGYIAQGNSNKETASILNVGTRTVETHRERLMRKLNIHSIAGLTQFAMQHGLVPKGRSAALTTADPAQMSAA